jgi:hypothetical protein
MFSQNYIITFVDCRIPPDQYLASSKVVNPTNKIMPLFNKQKRSFPFFRRNKKQNQEQTLSTKIIIESPQIQNTATTATPTPPIREVLVKREGEEPVPLCCGIGDLVIDRNLKKRLWSTLEDTVKMEQQAPVTRKRKTISLPAPTRTTTTSELADDASGLASIETMPKSIDISNYSGDTPVINNLSRVATGNVNIILSTVYAPLGINTAQEKGAFQRAISDLILS